jgi:hypothetical protein
VSKKTFLKVTGFVGTLGAGAALVATAATGTGAWFTDSEAGSISANTGALNVTLTGGHANMNFADLMPGTPQSDNLSYKVTQSSGQSDVWLTFNPASAEFAAFTGPKDSTYYAGGGLGRYGHFLVKDDSGHILFQSNNLASHPANEAGPNCSVNSLGHGGSSAAAQGVNDAPAYCGVPSAIQLAAGLNSGDSRTFTIEFGVSGRMVDQNKPLPTVPFKVVATQAGHGPNDANF